MKKLLTNHPVKGCWVLFIVLIVVHVFEAIVLRMDETLFGENFINKLFGILMIWLVLRQIQWKWSAIGFRRIGLVKSVFFGFALAAAVFLVAYAVEFLILRGRGNSVQFGFFTTGFSLTGPAEIHRGIGFIMMCVFFNLINVIMEEGTFRGLFYGIVQTNKSARFALLFQAILFGIWHVVTPLHNFIDGDLNLGGFLGLSIGYIILAGIMGIKWGLLYQMTGSLYMGMADHFFNNCIATNLLHVTTESGTDEMMIVRVLIAQCLSFGTVVWIWRKRKQQKKH